MSLDILGCPPNQASVDALLVADAGALKYGLRPEVWLQTWVMEMAFMFNEINQVPYSYDTMGIE